MSVFDLELLPKLKLKSLQVVARLVIYWLSNADFKRAHRRNPGNSDSRGIAQTFQVRSRPARTKYSAAIQKRTQAHGSVVPHAGHGKQYFDAAHYAFIASQRSIIIVART